MSSAVRPGWEAWRGLAGRYGLGLVQAVLQAAVEAGAIIPQPVVPLAHVLIGALDERALCVRGPRTRTRRDRNAPRSSTGCCAASPQTE